VGKREKKERKKEKRQGDAELVKGMLGQGGGHCLEFAVSFGRWRVFRLVFTGVLYCMVLCFPTLARLKSGLSMINSGQARWGGGV